MKRKGFWAVLAVLVVVLALVAPYVESGVAQRLLTRHLDQVNTAFASRELPIRVSLRDYQRGWRQSRVRYQIRFNLPGDNAAKACLAIPARIHHGWAQLLTGHWLELDGSPTSSANCGALAELARNPSLAVLGKALKGAKIQGSVYFTGASQLKFSSPAIGKADAGDVQFGAVSAAFRTSGDQQTLDYRIQWGGLKLPLEQALRSAILQQQALGGIGTLSITGRQNRYLRHLSTGRFAARIDSLTYLVAAHGQATRFRLEGLAFQARTHAKQGKLDSRMSLALANLKLNGVDLGALHVVGRFDGLHGKPWDQFSDAVVSLRRQTRPGGGETPAAFLARLPLSAIGDGIDGMKDAQFRLERADYRLGGQQIHLSGRLGWPALGTLRPEVVKANPAVLLKVVRANLAGEMDGQFPQALARRAAVVMGNQTNQPSDQIKALQASLEQRVDQFMARLVGRGLLTRKKGSNDYGLTASYQAGSVMLNGHPWPAPGT